MIIHINHEVAFLTDQYTGSITSGGTATLATSSPFTNGGKYLRLSASSSNFLYAYKSISSDHAAAIVASGQMWCSFKLRVNTFPSDFWDVFAVRSAASSPNVVSLIRFVKSGSDWKLRLYLRRDDGAMISIDTGLHTAAWWQSERLITVGLFRGAGTGKGKLIVGNPNSTDMSVQTANIANTIQLAGALIWDTSHHTLMCQIETVSSRVCENRSTRPRPAGRSRPAPARAAADAGAGPSPAAWSLVVPPPRTGLIFFRRVALREPAL